MCLNTNIRFSLKLWLFNCTQQMEYFCQEKKTHLWKLKGKIQENKRSKYYLEGVFSWFKANDYGSCESKTAGTALPLEKGCWHPKGKGKSPLPIQENGKILFHQACFSPFSKFPHTNLCQFQYCMSFNSLQIFFFSSTSGTRLVLLKCTFYSYGVCFVFFCFVF